MTAPTPYALDPRGEHIQEEIRLLRERGPLTRVELPAGVPAWAITDAALLKDLMTDSRVSKDATQHWAAFRAGEIPASWPLMPWVASRHMFTAYGTDHRRLRRLVAPAFTQRRTMAMRPRIEQITQATLHRTAAAGTDRTGKPQAVDLRQEFAYPIPIEVIGELIGVPAHLASSFRRCADRSFDTSATPEQMLANQAELQRTLEELIAYRQDQPGDDLTSVLLSMREQDDDALADDELLATIRLIIVAGHETTVNLLDQAVTALLTHPEALAAVRSGEATWDQVIEETLRYESPVASAPLRYAVEDIDTGDVVIRKGEAILAVVAAAGRDPKVHEDADVFDLARESSQHIAFGHGVHHCIGAPLARLEASIALPALFGRFPDMSFAVDPGTIPAGVGFIANGHATLPVHLGHR